MKYYQIADPDTKEILKEGISKGLGAIYKEGIKEGVLKNDTKYEVTKWDMVVDDYFVGKITMF